MDITKDRRYQASPFVRGLLLGVMFGAGACFVWTQSARFLDAVKLVRNYDPQAAKDVQSDLLAIQACRQPLSTDDAATSSTERTCFLAKLGGLRTPMGAIVGLDYAYVWMVDHGVDVELQRVAVTLSDRSFRLMDVPMYAPVDPIVKDHLVDRLIDIRARILDPKATTDADRAKADAIRAYRSSI